MFNSIPLLFALTIAPSATTAIEPTSTSARSVIEQDSRYATAQSKSIVGSGFGAGGFSQGGMPTYGATAGTGVTRITPGRTQVGGVSLDYFTISFDPGTGFNESFILYIPMKPKAAARPMLVAFHKFGNTQKDITYNTSFAAECAARGWYMLAPLSASGGHMMSDAGMGNTEAAMAWVLNKFPVDLSRIYAVGFSMGGGMAMNYGARHLDPERGMFAAIYNHSGSVDLVDTYENDPASAFVFDFWYGDETPGSADYDEMIRSSVIRYNPVTGQVDPTSDIVRNLSHVALKTIRASNDPLVLLSQQSDRLDAHLQTLGRTPGPSYSYQVVSGDQHSWDTISEKAACDWLSQFSLSLPSSQRTLASKETFYFHFYVDMTDKTKLTPFTWEVDPIANELRISETANMTSLSVMTEEAGLMTNQQLQVVMTTADGKMNKVSLTGYPVKPASVSRDGTVLPANYWAYSAAGGIVTLTEFDGLGVHAYTIMP